eukprot:4419400-Amphidinium_carterae.1
MLFHSEPVLCLSNSCAIDSAHAWERVQRNPTLVMVLMTSVGMAQTKPNAKTPNNTGETQKQANTTKDENSTKKKTKPKGTATKGLSDSPPTESQQTNKKTRAKTGKPQPDSTKYKDSKQRGRNQDCNQYTEGQPTA